MITSITGTCGHTYDKNILTADGNEPKTKGLNNGIRFWSTRTCLDCYKATLQTKQDEALATLPTLAQLQGSEKQVAWATTIRNKTLTALIEQVTFSVPWATTSLLAKIADAKFWIDTRDEDLEVFVGIQSHNCEITLDYENQSVILAKRAKPILIEFNGRYDQAQRLTKLVGGTKYHGREVAMV